MDNDNYPNLRRHLSSLQAKRVYRMMDKKEAFVPVSVFSEQQPLLETIVKYLKQEGLGFADIARLTNRAPSTISTTYFNAKGNPVMRKLPGPSIPVSAIADRRLSTFESLVFYLRYRLEKSLSDISGLLRRNLKAVCRTHHNALVKLDKDDYMESIIKNEQMLLSVINKNFKDMHELDKVLRLNKQGLIPASIFLQDLSPLKAVVGYLKGHMGISEIASGLNRSKALVSLSYTAEIKVTDYSYNIPLRKLSDRKFSIMESVVCHLIRGEGLTVSDTARMLHRNPSNISQLYKRYKDKESAG